MKITDSPGAMLEIPASGTATPNDAELSSIFQPVMSMAVSLTLVTSNQSAATGLLPLDQGATSEITSDGCAGSSLITSMRFSVKSAVASGVAPTLVSSSTTVML